MFGPALVGLTRGVQEARTKSQAGGDFLPVAHAHAHVLQRLLMRLVHLDVAEQRKIIARLQPIQVRPQISYQRLIRTRRRCRAPFAFASSVNRSMPFSERIGDSGGSDPVFSYSEVSLRVSILLASTSG